MDKFKELYALLDEELRTETVTLGDHFEVQRRSKSSSSTGEWMLCWATCAPKDCKLSIFKDKSEGELVASIFLKDCQVLQVIGGMPPDQAHLFHVDHITTWSDKEQMSYEPCEFHFAAIDREQVFDWAQRIQENIDLANASDINEMMIEFSAGLSEAEDRIAIVAGHKPPSEVYVCGSNAFGQLGTDCNRSFETPQPILDLSGKKIACAGLGSRHSLIYTHFHGELFSFGDNEHGQLGLGHTHRQNYPQRVRSLCSKLYQEENKSYFENY